MPPALGKIQPLPIKVLYTIDTSPQSFLAVLPSKQDVFVHPPNSPGGDLIGTCALKAVARGICYASPECVPNRSSLDFSVYNLDPIPRPLGARAFPAPPPVPASWTGKGFLSWALAESGDGTVLVRGRLVREYEFASTCFAAGGGLEGLVAAANSATAEEKDGRGWGLEITLTLRQLNPEGKNEFAGRKQFDVMLAEGKCSASAPLAVTSPARRPPPPGTFARPAVPAAKPPSPLRHTTSQPPSMASQPVAGPSKLRPVAPAPPQPKRTPPSRQLARAPPSSPTPTRSRAARERERENTPPSRPRDRTPPPRPIDPSILSTPQPSPTRATLIKLLKCEGKMSPEMARRMANNEFLQRLMRALPPGEVDKAAVSPGARPPMPPMTGLLSDPMSGPSHPPSDIAPTPTTAEMCYHCSATDTVGTWMRKKLTDGSSGLVCNPCGLYFNKHKRMRPRELWGEGLAAPAPPVAVRSSPRLSMKRDSAPPPVSESPRKRARRQPPPSPSPRRATRLAAREAEKDTEAGSPTPGGAGTPLDYASHFPFGSAGSTPRAGPSGMHPSSSHSHASHSMGTPSRPPNGAGGTAGLHPLPPATFAATGAMAAAPLLDPEHPPSTEELESLFLQFTDEDAAPAAPADPNDAVVSLENLFGSATEEGIMELLRSIEASSDPPSVPE